MYLVVESYVDCSIIGFAVFIEINIVGIYVFLEVVCNYWFGLDDEKKKNFRFYYIFIDEVYGDLFYLDEVNSNEML